MYTDPSGEFIFSAFLGPLGVAMDNACWGGLIGGAGYAAQTLFSGGKFESKAFWHSVGVGAISGVVTGGIGDMFGPLGGGLDGIGNQIAHEAGRAFTHGVANGLIAANTGGNMMQSFASGTLGSLGGSAFQAFGGEFAKSAVGIVGFSAVSGGVGAKLTGGDFWEGAATGATVGALNHYGHLGVGKAVKKAVAAIKQMDRDLENGDGFGQGIGEANPRSREQVIAGTRNTISLVGGWQLNTAMALYDISQDNSAANYLALGGAFLPKYIRNEGINAILSVSDTYKVSEKGYKYVGGKIQPKRHK